jgi:hypothetical protein
MQNLSEGENATLGVASGLIEVTVMQSTNYLKNAKQQGLPMTADPRVLYRGYLPNCANMGLATGFQFFVNGAIKKALTGGSSRALTPAEQVRAASHQLIGQADAQLPTLPLVTLAVLGLGNHEVTKYYRVYVGWLGGLQIGAGFVAGASSAVVVSPLELTMVQQQVHGPDRCVFCVGVGVELRSGLRLAYWVRGSARAVG